MQQIPFIHHFKSGLHVLSDKLDHPQEQLLILYTAFGTMHRNCCRQVTSLSSISTLSPVGRNTGALYQKLYIQSKSAPEDGRVCRPKHVEFRSIFIKTVYMNEVELTLK